MITHLNKNNEPRIVDINSKKNTKRSAKAEGKVTFSKKVFDKITFKKIEKLKSKKGSIKNIAIMAGIMGAKETSRLIPLCHNINLENVDIHIKPIKKDSSLKVIADVKTFGKTGVEMEALTAVSISCLTIYDMCKSLDKSITIKEIKLIAKKGGKSDFKVDK